MSIEIITPEAETLFPPKGLDSYVDVHGILEAAISLAVPTCPTCGDTWAPGTANCACDLAFLPSSSLLLNGPHGVGKSLLAANLAVQLGKKLGREVPMVTFDCSEDTREYHLKGTAMAASDGSTPFVLGPFPAAIHLANELGISVFCAEEISALTPGSQKIFNVLTDWRNSLYLPQISKLYALKPGHRVIVIASMNPEAYGGVFTLNKDLRSRFDEFAVPLPGMASEKKILKTVCPWADSGLIEKACQFARDSRTDTFEYDLSTRDLVKLLQNIRKMGDTVIPLLLVANKFEGSEKATILDRIHATFRVRLSE